ncbi:TIR domain-containing protein [Haemophilus haemolyticus]|uniref:TIR domain-containing protein n=1 Tax=Haemophilus haemolyticus TaxID=726 RepID=UPI000E5959C0|nr:TIR domain-containing protein [Haemophilus haemolyticus]
MGRKIFISYKYSDSAVKQFRPHDIFHTTTARDYVDILQAKLNRDGIHINKGEKDDESLADFKDDTIQGKLADKIFDSSVTVVLLSPNMKEEWVSENDQWIPWEIAYSLRNKTRAFNKSKRNAILLVALPDINGCYEYTNQTGFLFNIIQKNLNNLQYPYPATKLRNGICSQSYMLRCNWDQFISNVNGWIDAAVEIKENADKYRIQSSI